MELSRRLTSVWSTVVALLCGGAVAFLLSGQGYTSEAFGSETARVRAEGLPLRFGSVLPVASPNAEGGSSRAFTVVNDHDVTVAHQVAVEHESEDEQFALLHATVVGPDDEVHFAGMLQDLDQLTTPVVVDAGERAEVTVTLRLLDVPNAQPSDTSSRFAIVLSGVPQG